MSALIRVVLVAVSLGAVASAASAGDVSVGVSITGEILPGVYGQVDLSNRPPPPLLYATPVVIERPPPHVVYQPIYMHVPPGHAKNWRKHCHEYNACGRPVYFVKSAEYEPGYKKDDHGKGHGKSGEHGNGKGRH